MTASHEQLRFSELTPPGAGAIRVLELAGPGALGVLQSLSGRELWEPGALRLALLRNPNAPHADAREVLDEALCHVVDEERVELHVHGSEPLIRELRELCQIQFGATVAKSEASYHPLEERALSLVPEAPSEAGARLLLDQAGGSLRREIERLLSASAEDLRSGLRVLKEAGRIARFALRQTPVVIAGPVNAGKSTLFNLLVRRAGRVLMSPVPGTTRDAVAELALFGPWPVQLYDTAGTRDLAAESGEGDELIERAGQELAERLRLQAELVLFLHPASPEAPRIQTSERKVRVLRSMADRSEAEPNPGEPRFSVHADPEEAAAICHRVFAEAFQLPGEAWRADAPTPFDDVSRVAIDRALGELGASTVGSKIESARAHLRSLLEKPAVR